MDINYWMKSFLLVISLTCQCTASHSQKSAQVYPLLNQLDMDIHDTLKVQALFDLAEVFYLNLPDSALYYCHQAQIRSKNISYYEGIVSSHNWIGYIHWQKSELKEALESFEMGLALLRPDDVRNRSDLLGNIGYVYKDLGDLKKGLKFLQRGLAASVELKDTAGISLALNNIGLIHKEIGDYDKALDYLERSLRLKTNAKSASNVLNNMATIFGERGNHSKAIEYLYQSLRASSIDQDYGIMAMVMDNLGYNYQGLAYQDSALYYFKESAKTAQRVGNKFWESSALSHLGRFYMLNNEFDSASLYLNQAYAMSLEIGYPERIRDVSELLFELHTKTQNWESALFFHQEYTKIRDSMVNVANIKQVYKYELGYEYERKMLADSIVNEESKKLIESELKLQKQEAIKEKKEKEQNLIWTVVAGLLLVTVVLSLIRINSIRKKSNQTLSDKNNEITQKSHDLEAALSERDLLLKEIHHRVKNNLQTVSSLMSLQTRYLQETSAIEALEESQNRLLSISLLHQKLYQNENTPLVILETYFSELTAQIKETCSTEKTKVDVELVCDQLTCNIELAMPLGLILNELMTNAYKYAFTDKSHGHIKIYLSAQNEGGYCLELSDNGVGLPENFSLEKNQSMGLNLVKLLTKQIKGNLKIEQEVGAKFVISFKHPEKLMS